jgi:hypothetical protein
LKKKEKKLLKPWQTPLNKAPSKGGKERTQRGKHLSMSQKSKLQSKGHKGVKEQIKSQKKRGVPSSWV